MKVEEFLASEHFEPRTKISAFDAEIRLLRSRGVSGQNIAKFLTLNDVPATKNSVNKYFLRHPDSYSDRSQLRDSSRNTPAQSESTTSPRREAPLSIRQPSDSAGSEVSTQTATLREGERDLQSATHSHSAHATIAARLPEDMTGKNSGRDSTREGHAMLPEHSSETTKDSENSVAFDPILLPASNYDGNAGTRERAKAVVLGADVPRRSPILHYDPMDPANKEGVRLYLEGLKAGTIRTGETTNSERHPNERHENPDPS